MRLGWLCLLVVGCRMDEGAQLALQAPLGPDAAVSLELVLASPAVEPVVSGQRKGPRTTETEDVTYYLQRTTAGAAPGAIDQVDGFTVRVTPDPTIADSAFVPFVLLRDERGALVGIGTYHARGSQAPSPILVQSGEIDTYAIDVEPMTAVDGSSALGQGDAFAVSCTHDDQSTFTSGIAWRPGTGGELRLLLPDHGSDATGRALDLDCDGQAVSPAASAGSDDDCDDTRAAFHAGAAESCDGLDTDCDGQSYLAVACTSGNACPDPSTGMGIALCDDTTGMVGACQADPGCSCATSGNAGCTQCVIAHPLGTTVGQISPCQPGIGILSTQGLCEGGTCQVDVALVRGGWEAKVATTDQGSFDRVATGVTGSFALEARRPEGPGASIPGRPGTQTGEVDLVIIDPAGAAHLVGVALMFDGDVPTVCPGSGPFQMHCSP